MKKWIILLQAAVLVSAGFFFVSGSAKANASKVLIEKRYWSDDAAVAEPRYTFGPGDTVIASISVASVDGATNEVNIVDVLPSKGISAQRLSDVTKCHTPSVENVGFSGTNELTWSDISVSQSAKYFCYKFQIDTSIDARNYAEQVGIKVVDKDLGTVVGTENNYLLLVGALWGNSMGTTVAPQVVETPGADGKIPSIDTKIDDTLLKDSTSIRTKDNVDASKYSSFLYKTATGKSSRGGYLNSYPVKITNKSGSVVYGAENFYLFYNPLYYLFGNVFSGDSSTTRAFDFGSRGSTIARKDGDTNKLNSEATLYNYDFDANSLVHWDSSNPDKNKQMYENIKKYISEPRPGVVCELLAETVFTAANFYLKNDSCNSGISPVNQNLYPNGRVWYFKPDRATSGDTIDFDTTFRGKGTVIIDFESYRSGNVPVVNIKKNLPDDSYLGLIVINGGNVLLTNNLEKFNGIIFVPGRL